MYTYRAKVTRVVDGDTFHAEVDLGFKLTMKQTFRLAEIDTPETFRPKSEAERAHGQQAKEFVKRAIEGKIVTVKTKKTGKYGRYIAYVTYGGGLSLLQELMDKGFEKKESYDTI